MPPDPAPALALNITFTPLDTQGKAGTPSTGGWDIVTNTAS